MAGNSVGGRRGDGDVVNDIVQMKGGLMKAIGIVRKIDSIGRIVMPKEARTMLGMSELEPVEMYVDNDGLVIKKYQPQCIFCDSFEEVVDYKGSRVCKACLRKLKEKAPESADENSTNTTTGEAK